MIKKLRRRFAAWMSFNPPGALSSKSWRLFKNEFKEKAPIRYWLDNDLRMKVLYPIKWKYQAINQWIRYRTYDRYHIVHTGLKPGYHDVREQMLHVNFNMLKEFVEVEQAWRTFWWDSDIKKTWIQRHSPIFKMRFRNPELGIKHFEWATTLDDPSLPPHERCDQQAISAREILALYDWWVNKRPARKELKYPSYSNQGLGDLSLLDEDFDKESEDYKEYKKVVEKNNELEQTWNNEDNEMLIRLMKIRESLWT
jgi:hypothetical protein